MIHIKDLSRLSGKTVDVIKISDCYCFMDDNNVYSFYNGKEELDLPEKIIPITIEVRIVYVLDRKEPSVYQTVELDYYELGSQERKISI